MNEITRIHLAKTSYDIEVSAKKQLDKYIKSLEQYTNDTDVLADIEIRMTELLAERGVAAGGVIDTTDVTAIKEQLGEPHEFADEGGDMAIGSTPRSGRPLFRSTDDAVLGGVLSGIATYFGVSPVWTRLIFVLLLFMSFGAAVFVYILLWIIVPPARTAADKLQLAGKPVTVESIRDLSAGDDEPRANQFAPMLQRVLGIGLGSLSALAAIGTVVAVIAGVFVMYGVTGHLPSAFMDVREGYGWAAWVLFALAIAGGLLLAALFSLIGYALFARKMTKRLGISMAVVTALGLTTFIGAIGVAATQSWRVTNETQSLVQHTRTNLAQNFSDVRTVVIDAPSNDQSYNTAISYVVDQGTPHYELSALPGAKPKITIDGQTAHVSLTIPASYRNSYVQPSLTIYGPALDSLINDNGSVTYDATTQNKIQFTVKNSASLSVTGTFEMVTASGKGSVDVSSSSVGALTVQSDQGLSVTAGTVRSLVVAQPDVCPSASYQDTTVRVSGVTSGTMQYNGQQRTAATYRTSCASVVVGDQNDTLGV